jgi:hypothetical protein
LASLAHFGEYSDEYVITLALLTSEHLLFFLADASRWKVKWFNRAPVNYLGVIVYLSQGTELSDLNMSLLSLRQYLFKPRPVVIFHEGDLEQNNIQLALANTLAPDIPLGFERIRFPTRVNDVVLGPKAINKLVRFPR